MTTFRSPRFHLRRGASIAVGTDAARTTSLTGLRVLPCAGGALTALAADATGTPAAAAGTGAASPISIATGGTSPRIRAFHSDIVLPASNH